MTTLTDRQKRFCEEYIKDFNGKAAAIRAGYAPKSAKVMASKLLTKGNLRVRLKQLTDRITEAAELSATWVINQLKDLSENAQSESARVQATVALGKYFSLFTNKLEVTQSPLTEMSDERLEEILQMGISPSH